MSETRSLWHELKGKECASAVKEVCDALEKTQRPRRARWSRNASLYEARPLGSLSPDAYFTTDELVHDDFDALRVNIARMLVNAAHAKIAGKQKPKTQFVVNDGDWQTKRKAKKLERLNEALMLQRQGPSADAWEETLKAQLFACVGDLGAVKTTANVAEKRIEIRAVPGWQLLVDPVDAAEGQPLSLFHIYPADKFKLAAQFPKFKEEIMAAPDLSGESNWAGVFGRTSDVSRICLVREAWRLQIAKGQPGRHAIAVGGADLAEGEKWERDFFPFEFYVWEQWLQGIYGTSIVDNVYHLTLEANASMQRMSEAERFGSNQMVFYWENTVDQEKIEGNAPKTMVPVKQGAPSLPTFTTPNAISSSSVQWWQLLVGTSHDVSGVSEMAATGQKEPGVDSGAAMRTLAMLGTERFSVQWQAYERRTSVGQARQNIACVRELIAEVPDYKVSWPGQNFLQELTVADVMLDDELFRIQPYPVNGIWNTPPDRIATGSELYDRQIISGTAYAAIQSSKDVEGETGRMYSWGRLIDSYIEDWLDATPESEARGAEGDPKGFRYNPPIKFMPLPDVIVQVGRAYADALLDKCPDYNQQFFIKFMKDADRQILQIEAEKAQAAAAMAPPPMAPPGAPPPPMPPDMGAPPPGGMLQ